MRLFTCRSNKVTLKAGSFLLSFIIIYELLQAIFILPFAGSEIANDFFELEENSVDVLFLGASQMYCGINAQKLTDEYGILSYDFGGGGQSLMISYYYLQEALKHQKPHLVCVEVCKLFDADITSLNMIQNYPAMPMTLLLRQ